MTKHQIEGAIEAMEAAKALQSDHEATNMDIDHVALDGARSDKDACDEQSLLKAIRNLNNFIMGIAIAVTNVDVTSEDPDYVGNGMVSWPSFKIAQRVLLKALGKVRRSTVAGPFGGRTGSTTGGFETDSQECKQQVHLADIPVGDKALPGIVRWEYHPDRYETNSDGTVARFPEWEVEPEMDVETGEITKPGVMHERAGEPIAMWRLAALYIIEDGNQAKFDELADLVHSAQQQVRQNRRAEEDARTASADPMQWGVDAEALFPELRKSKRAEKLRK